MHTFLTSERCQPCDTTDLKSGRAESKIQNLIQTHDLRLLRRFLCPKKWPKNTNGSYLGTPQRSAKSQFARELKSKLVVAVARLLQSSSWEWDLVGACWLLFFCWQVYQWPSDLGLHHHRTGREVLMMAQSNQMRWECKKHSFEVWSVRPLFPVLMVPGRLFELEQFDVSWLEFFFFFFAFCFLRSIGGCSSSTRAALHVACRHQWSKPKKWRIFLRP